MTPPSFFKPNIPLKEYPLRNLRRLLQYSEDEQNEWQEFSRLILTELNRRVSKKDDSGNQK